MTDVSHRTNVTLYPQIYRDEQGDLFDIVVEKVKHKRFYNDFINQCLLFCFELEIWGVSDDQRFTFGTKYPFFMLAKKILALGANFYRIESKMEFKTKYIKRIALWHILRLDYPDNENVVEYFEKSHGVFGREVYDEVMKKAIKMKKIEVILDAVEHSANIGRLVEEYTQDICNIHIMNWPEYDLFGLFQAQGILQPAHLNRIKNKLIHHANTMLIQSLTETWIPGDGKDYDLTLKALQAGANFQSIIDNDIDGIVLNRLLFMIFSAYFAEDESRAKDILNFLAEHGVNIQGLSLKLLEELYNREFPYYQGLGSYRFTHWTLNGPCMSILKGMRTLIINSEILENLYSNINEGIDQMIWHLIFM